MIAEKPQTEPSMDEILESIRKIISTEAAESVRVDPPALFSVQRSEDILDLTDMLPEEPSLTLETQNISSRLEDPFLSQATIAETTQAFYMLKTMKPKPAELRSQAEQPLEALVKDMLKPLMKEWLDANLPAITRSVVGQQVERIARQTERDEAC